MDIEDTWRRWFRKGNCKLWRFGRYPDIPINFRCQGTLLMMVHFTRWQQFIKFTANIEYEGRFKNVYLPCNEMLILIFQKHILRIYIMWDTSTHKSQGDSNFFDSRQILFETRNVALWFQVGGFLRKRRIWKSPNISKRIGKQ